MTNFKWPTRDEWAVHVRTPYADLFDGMSCPRGIRHYASQAQIDDIIRQLKALYASEGQRLREAKPVHDALVGGTTRSKQIRGYYSLTREQQEQCQPFHDAREHRREINRVIKGLMAGEGIQLYGQGVIADGHACYWEPVNALFAEFIPAFKANYDAAVERRTQEIASTPIDDEAWATELRRRAWLDRSHGTAEVRDL